MTRKVLMLEDKSGEMIEVPSKLELCAECEGHGTVENPAFSNGITSSEWAEWDDEDRQRYMAGAYDVTCPCCSGERVQLVADVARMNFGQRRLVVLARQSARADRDYQREVDAERRYFGHN